jgi:hypothetical protein
MRRISTTSILKHSFRYAGTGYGPELSFCRKTRETDPLNEAPQFFYTFCMMFNENFQCRLCEKATFRAGFPQFLSLKEFHL